MINRLSICIMALAALVKDSGIINLDAFAEAITTFQKPATAKISLKALDAGSALIRPDKKWTVRYGLRTTKFSTTPKEN